MEWEELFVNGIYDFGGKPLPINPEKTLKLVCKRDALDAFIQLEIKTHNFDFLSENKMAFICYVCGLFNAVKIYKYMKSSHFAEGKMREEDLFKNIKQHFYGGLIKANPPQLLEKLFKFMSKKKIKHLRRIRITTFLFQEKNYTILEKIFFLLKPEAIATALTDAINADLEVYEFAIKFVPPVVILEIVLYGAYERDIKYYKDKIKFLRDKIAPPALEPLNKECFKLLGVHFNYF